MALVAVIVHPDACACGSVYGCMVQVEKAKRGQAASSLSLRSASCMLMLSTCLNMCASPSCMPFRSYPPAFGKRLAQLWVEAPVEPNISLRSWIDFLVKLSTCAIRIVCRTKPNLPSAQTDRELFTDLAMHDVWVDADMNSVFELL